MKNISRAFLKKKEKEKGRQAEPKRKHPSVSSVLDTPIGPSPVILLPSSSSATSGFKPQESPTHNIIQVQQATSPRKDSQTPQEAWVNTKILNVVPSGISSTIPKVFVDDAQTTREGVISITKDVQKFLATISELRQAIEEMDLQTQEEKAICILDDKRDEDKSSEGDIILDDKNKEDEDKVVDKLKKLIQVVEECLQSNPGMQSTELTETSKQLLNTYKSCDHDNDKVSDCKTCNTVIFNLVDTFTHCVSDYMAGDTADASIGMLSTSLQGIGGIRNKNISQSLSPYRGLQSSKSQDNLARFSSSVDLTQAHEPIIDTIDQALSTIENSVEVVAGYIKFRQKYHREIVGYLTKRAHIEQRYYSQLGKAVRQTQAAISELQQQEDCLPLFDVFHKTLEQDSHYAMNCNTTFNLQTGHKVLEPLEHKISECEKMRKDLIHNWQREKKKLLEAKTSMKNCKAKYHFYGHELSRAKNQLSLEPYGKQADKRKKEVADLENKFQESEEAYKNAIAHCNDCQYQVHETAQKSILCAFRRIVVGIDTTLKAGLDHYYQLQHNFFKSLPDPLTLSCEEVRGYECGKEFLNFIEKHPRVSDELEDFHFEEFDPDEEGLWDNQEESNLGMDHVTSTPHLTLLTNSAHRALSPTSTTDTNHTTQNNFRLGQQNIVLRTDTPSPKAIDRKFPRPNSIAFLDTNLLSESVPSTFQRRNSEKNKDPVNIEPSTAGSTVVSPYSSIIKTSEDYHLSRVARTHVFKKLLTPSRCRGCETYVYFHGFECEICSLACHKKCLSTLAIRCGNKKLPRKMNTFGVNFREHLLATKRMIPIIVTKCINELDERGLDTQGLYRISSAKSKMEKLCQLFESGAERVDLSELPPHLISSCLKLYFRQLPEPLLTYELYHDFLKFSKEGSACLPCNFKNVSNDKAAKARELLDKLENLINQLPEPNRLTLTRLMYHLNRASSPDHVKTNCMPASNMGIVFGPNLLRQKEVLSSLDLLANMSHQAKVVEIMTAHAHDIFHISEESIKQLEVEPNEDYESTNERLVGDIPQSFQDVNYREEDKIQLTPYNTPPEKRRQNVEELHGILEDFCSSNNSSHLKMKNTQMIPAGASPLLTDSRNWDKDNDDYTQYIPGTVDDQSFAESIFNIVEERIKPHIMYVPSTEKTLTPLMEKEDHLSHSDNDEDEGSIDILNVLEDNAIGIHTMRRQRTHSLSNDEDIDKVDNVFHSRGPSDTNETARNFFLSCRSEENLTHNSYQKKQRREVDSTLTDASFESTIMKCLDEDGRHSVDSFDSQEYKPFESANVQALLLPSRRTYSSKTETIPARSLPRNFYRPPLLPMPRQMSEGQIKQVKSPHFTVGSPPLMSPVSTTSVEKSLSVPSSRGSISESYLEDFDKKQKKVICEEKSLNHKADSGSEDNNRISGTSADEDVHDEFPVINLPKQSFKIKLTASRDSGLSDSPDPFVDICSSPNNNMNSVLAVKLAQLDKENNQKLHQSPLVNEQRKDVAVQKKNNNIEQEPINPSRVARHVMRVMKITPTKGEKNPPLLSPENEINLPDERLRMVSPDAVISQASSNDWNLKRSKSHAEGTFNRAFDDRDDEECRTHLISDLIMSKGKNSQKISPDSLLERSKSLEAL